MAPFWTGRDTRRMSGCSRRGFCKVAGAAVALSACGVEPRLFVGKNDDPPPNEETALDGGADDLAKMQQNGDLGHSSGPPDMAHVGGTCGGKLDAGLASAIGMNAAKHFSSFLQYDLFLCRDAGGLFAVDALCTHSGCEVQLQTAGGPHWYCNCHGATFQFDGTHPTSPAPTPLNTYAVCIDGNGHAIVDYATVVTPSTRA